MKIMKVKHEDRNIEINHLIMATRKKTETKADLTTKLSEKTNTNRSKDFETLELAKEQEKKKRLKTVRIDQQTIIFVSVDKCPIKAVEEYREKLKRYESSN